MNILHIIAGPGPGGAEIYVKDLAKQQSHQGHNLHVAFISDLKDLGGCPQYSSHFINDLQAVGVKTFTIGHESRKKPWLGALRLRHYMKKHKIQVCHAHLAYGVLFSCLSRVPVVFTYHTSKVNFNKLTQKLLNSLVDEYVGISKVCAQNLRAHTGRDVVQINNAVAHDKLKNFKRVRKYSSPLNACMVGRLVPEKDYPNILNALSMLSPDAQSKLKIKIAGNTNFPVKDYLDIKIKELNLENVVSFEGTATDIPSFLLEYDLFIMSSQTEGLPIALIEACISGLPCIVTDVGGCSEVVSVFKNGIVVPASSPESLSEALIYLLKNPNKIEFLSQNALNNPNAYSIEKATQDHLKLYRKLLR